MFYHDMIDQQVEFSNDTSQGLPCIQIIKQCRDVNTEGMRSVTTSKNEEGTPFQKVHVHTYTFLLEILKIPCCACERLHEDTGMCSLALHAYIRFTQC